MPVITNINDLKEMYRRRVPKMFFDYTESGSWTEQTFRDNIADFSEIRLRQRVAIDISARHTRSHMVGESVSMPVAIAPVGMTGLQSADGEIKAALAAEQFGVPFTLSTMSICSIEEVAAKTKKAFWFQLYVMRDKDFMGNLLQRAKNAGCSTLVITLDLQVLGQRHKDIKNGLSAPPKITISNFLDMLTKWSWGIDMLKAKRRNFGNIVGHASGVSDTTSLSAWTAEQFDPELTWEEVKRIRDMWDGKVVLKGILDQEDAKLAVDVGADAIIVSNHGGRQLDGAQSSIRMLPKIVEALDNQIEVHMDGGIRSGQDVLKSLAMGASGTYIGRSFVYGLGAMGQKGVEIALLLIQKELETSMALCGCCSVNDLSKDILHIPKNFTGDWI